jgi:hypothetical protein
MPAAFLLAAFLLVAPAAAQETPAAPPPVQGIGFAHSGAGEWLCRHEDPFEALACAQELCAEQSPGLECLPAAWCYPARWSGIMTVRRAADTTTHALCGAPNAKALGDALAALCAADEEAVVCDVTLTVDPEGHEQVVEGLRFAGAAPMPPGGLEILPAAEEAAPEAKETEPAAGGP